MTKRYFKVTTKCGHVGKKFCILIDFPVYAENAKEAAQIARNIPRVKHDHEDAIKNVQEITKEEYLDLIRINNEDPYLQCSSRHEQELLCSDLTDRLIVDNHKRKYDNEEHERDKKVLDYKRKKKMLKYSRNFELDYDIA